MELLRLPLAVRDMNWIEFLALGGSDKALEKVASSEVDIVEITQLASRAIQTPFRIAKKAKQPIDDEMEASLLPAGKKSRQENQAAADPEVAPQKPGKAQTSTKRPPNSKRTRPPSSRAKNFPKSKVSHATPVTSRGNPTKAATPLFTPAGKFDSSVFRTPGLRAPAAHEQVFSISVNGSPLADSSEVFLTVPLGRGEVRG
uniref:Borealin C-terminal domain-containing protein n=1 Tax=Naja naja TaxID=35670 RepID=A0A8C6XX74_NAJNA